MVRARGNIKPNPVLQGRDIQKKLARQTQDWIRANDHARLRKERKKANKAKLKGERQARDNPALIHARIRALRLA